MSLETVTFGALCEEIYRYPTYYDIEYVESGIPEIRGELIQQNGTINTEQEKWRFIDKETSNRFPRTVLRENDLVMSVRGTIGKVALIPPELDGANMTANLLRISPNRSVVFPRYLWGYMRSSYFVNELDQISPSTTIKTIRVPDLRNLPIPLPPLAEQQRIAAILDKADTLRTKRRAALAKLDTLLQATFLHMFGDPVTNPMGWEVKYLEDLCSLIVDCPHSTPKYTESDTLFACVRSSDIQNGYLDWTSTKYVEENEYRERVQRASPMKGDVIYCREGARFGNAARVLGDKQVCLGQRMMLFRPAANIATSEFIWRYLESEGAYQQATKLVGGSAAPHINIQDIKKFSVGLPPLEVQQVFSRITKVVDSQRVIQNKNLQKFDNLFHSLQQRAFKGEL